MNTWCSEGGGIFTYKLHKVGSRTEFCSTSARISLGAEISVSTETFNFLFHSKMLTTFTILVKHNFDNFYNMKMCEVASRAM